MTDKIAEQFEQVRLTTGGYPWFTQFELNGVMYGGTNSYSADPRVRDFLGWTPPNKLHSVLELASCEGGQSQAILRSPLVNSLTGLDGQWWLVVRSRFIADLFHLKATYGMCDFDSDKDLNELSKIRTSAIFCSGVLYHLLEPAKLIKSLVGVAQWFYLATHFTDETPNDTRNGYQGIEFQEPGIVNPWAAVAYDKKTFWFTLPELIRCLLDSGWSIDLMRVWNQWSSNDTRPMVGVLCKC